MALWGHVRPMQCAIMVLCAPVQCAVMVLCAPVQCAAMALHLPQQEQLSEVSKYHQ